MTLKHLKTSNHYYIYIIIHQPSTNIYSVPLHPPSYDKLGLYSLRIYPLSIHATLFLYFSTNLFFLYIFSKIFLIHSFLNHPRSQPLFFLNSSNHLIKYLIIIMILLSFSMHHQIILSTLNLPQENYFISVTVQMYVIYSHLKQAHIPPSL